MMSRTTRLIGVTVALVLGACGSAFGATTANLWIDTDGGTCTRSGSTVAYSNAAACSPDDAWQASSAGDLILFKGGSYGGVRLNQKTGASNPRVLVQPETNADVSFDWLQMAGPSYMTMQAPQSAHPFLVGTGGVGFPGRDPNWFQRFTQDVTLDGFKVDGNNQAVGGTIIWINGNNDNITLDHFDVCCTTGTNAGGAGILLQTDQDSAYTPNTNLTIQNSYFHDQTIESGVHTECLWLSAGINITVRNNVFRRCSGTGDIVFARPPGTLGITDPRGFVLENNLFGAGTGPGGTPITNAIQGCWFPDTIFRNNIFEADINNSADGVNYCDGSHPADFPAGTATFVNNVGYHGSCGPSAVYTKNTWTTVSCGTDNPYNANILTASNFVGYNGNTLTTAPPYDLTPTAGSPLVNTGSTSNWAAADFYGRTRCPGATSTWTCTAGSETGSAPDLGPVERGATS